MLPKELFPVAAPNFEFVTTGSSRSSRRRRNAMSHMATWQTDCIRTLNELSGCSAALHPKERNSTQARCLNQLQNTFDHQAFPGDEPSYEVVEHFEDPYVIGAALELAT